MKRRKESPMAAGRAAGGRGGRLGLGGHRRGCGGGGGRRWRVDCAAIARRRPRQGGHSCDGEENFGPVAGIMACASDEEALARMNDSATALPRRSGRRTSIFDRAPRRERQVRHGDGVHEPRGLPRSVPGVDRHEGHGPWRENCRRSASTPSRGPVVGSISASAADTARPSASWSRANPPRVTVRGDGVRRRRGRGDARSEGPGGPSTPWR